MKRWMVYLARALALLWAGFWIFFAVASSIVEPPPAGMVVRIAAAGLLFLILALAPWRWEATRLSWAISLAGGCAQVVDSAWIHNSRRNLSNITKLVSHRVWAMMAVTLAVYSAAGGVA